MEDEGRYSIWSVSEEDKQLFSIMFPSLWLAGMAFRVVWAIPWSDGLAGAIDRLIDSVFAVAFASASLSLMILAGKAGIMVLFDWATRQRNRWREEGIEIGVEKGRLQERRDWEAWARRLREAKERGEDFDEPPPSSNS